MFLSVKRYQVAVHAPTGSDPFLAAVRAAVNKANQHEAAEKK